MLSNEVAICSWLVLDDEDQATEFPSTGSDSSSESFQLVYWHCLAVFFATSKVQNPSSKHVLFCNCDVTVHCPLNVLNVLRSLEVEFITLPLLYRFPSGAVSRWGNQFYVLDIINYFVDTEMSDGIVLTDSDCVWRKPLDTFKQEIFDNNCLLYTLRPADQKNYEPGNLLNGMTHDRMKEVVETTLNQELDRLPLYHGGEFFAATLDYCRSIQTDFGKLWHQAVSEVSMDDSIKEEAHFLSILAEARNVPQYTANHIVRRIWTHFKDINVHYDDLDLALWHLPAEKKFGFQRMYNWYVENITDWRSMSADELNVQSANFMGIPRRSPNKLVLDVVQKIGDKLTK